MKCVVLATLLLISLAALVLSDTTKTDPPVYTEYGTQHHGARNKRHISPSSLAFLFGIGAGGIFGPILYNRLYGWRPSVSVGWEAPAQGWEAPNLGWQENQGWSTSRSGYGGY